VPVTLLAVEAGDDYVVCELGSSAPGEIAHLAGIAGPNIAVITSVAPTHLQSLGSLQRVAAEKASILSGLADDGVAIVTADSEPLNRALRAYDTRLIRFGQSDSAELRLSDYRREGTRRRFQVNGRLWVKLGLLGRHNAVNALAAIGVARRFGFELQAAAEAMADFEGIQMRLELIKCGNVTVINDAYNANPASVAAAAEVLAEFRAKRRVMIVGDMRELGPQAEEMHSQLGREIAARKLDLLIGVGRLGRYIATAASQAGTGGETFDSTEAACEKAPGLLRRGDLVLIKGSRAMEMERLVEPIRAAFTKPAAGRKGKKTRGSRR